MENEKINIVSVRCSDLKVATGTRSFKRPCSKCGMDTWISPTFDNEDKNGRIDKIICERCFFESEEYKRGDYVANVKEESVMEAVNHLKGRGILKSPDEIVKKMEDKTGKKLKII